MMITAVLLPSWLSQQAESSPVVTGYKMGGRGTENVDDGSKPKAKVMGRA